MQYPASSSTPAPPLSLSSKARRTKEQPISFLINAAMANPSLVNLAAGLVDPLDVPARARWPLDPEGEKVRGAGVKA